MSNTHSYFEICKAGLDQLWPSLGTSTNGSFRKAVYALHPSGFYSLLNNSSGIRVRQWISANDAELALSTEIESAAVAHDTCDSGLGGELSIETPHLWRFIPVAVNDSRLEKTTTPIQVGFVILFSDVADELDQSECTENSDVISRLARHFYMAYCEELLVWHQSAQRTFVNTSRTTLNAPLWNKSRNQEDIYPHASLSKDHELDDSTKLRNEIARRTLRILKTGLKLDRCAILTPLPDSPDFWFYLKHWGFPDELIERKNFYIRGEGLTGRVLSLGRSNKPIVSEDVENDKRWSKRGKVLKRSETETGPLAFAGIPIYSQITKSEKFPFGALICCRFQNKQIHPQPFTEREIHHLQNVATQLAYGMDAIRWREDEKARLVRQLQLSRIWATQLSGEKKLEQAMEILAQEGPFRRILLSNVTPDKKWIVGKAASGFQKSLVSDTVRKIHSYEPSDEKSEDLLARVVRLSLTTPFEVDPQDPEDPWKKHMDQSTADRNAIRNKLMVIPLVDETSKVSGVVLAEYPNHVSVVPSEQIKRLSMYAGQLASLIQLDEIKSRTTKERDMFESVLEICASNGQRPDAMQTILREMMQRCCSVYEFDQGVAYIADSDSLLLRGIAAVGLNEQVVKATSYSLDIDSQTSYADGSFAQHVYRLRTPVFVDSLMQSPVDKIDCKNVGTDIRNSALGIPLVLGDECFGVVILIGKQAINPLLQSEPEVVKAGHLGALAIAFLQMRFRTDTAEAIHEAHEVCIQQTGRLSERTGSEESLKQLTAASREYLSIFVGEAADLLESKMCGLFTPDSPIRIGNHGSGRKTIANIDSGEPFFLRASQGYDPKHLESLFYSQRSKGLTSTVLRTLETQISKDVVEDKRWSSSLKDETKDLFKESNGLRTWLGTPIIFSEGDKQYLYGVLTFTRKREHRRDALSFQEKDCAIAERLAWMLAVGLHSQQSVHRMYESLKGQLRSFLHSVRSPLDLVQNDRLQSLRDFSGEPSVILRICDQVEQDLRFINAGFSAFTDFTRDDYEWLGYVPSVKLAEICDLVVSIARRKSSNVVIDDPIILPRDCCCRVDESRLIFILYALIENAVKAIREAGRPGTVKTKVQVENDLLKISVSDDGVGIKKENLGKIYNEFFSGFKTHSSGLGLTLLRRFVDSDAAGEVSVQSDENGTQFNVQLSIGKIPQRPENQA